MALWIADKGDVRADAVVEVTGKGEGVILLESKVVEKKGLLLNFGTMQVVATKNPKNPERFLGAIGFCIPKSIREPVIGDLHQDIAEMRG